MEKIIFSDEYFNVKDTLECGQIFRFKPYEKGYKVFSKDKCCYAYNEGDKAYIECEDGDKDYFYHFFDLDRDYSLIFESAVNSGFEIIKKCALLGKGIRILNQDIEETVFSFIISQNNNIPNIKRAIEKLCTQIGEKKNFLNEDYYSFPTAEKMAKKPIEFFLSISLGYRAEYIRRLAVEINNGYSLNDLAKLTTVELKKSLLAIYGIGPKVADCASLFGYHRSDAFPVDVWIEKVYREDFKGTLTDRKKISLYFTNTFKENSGYFQQYLFYYKRSLENL